MFLLYINSKKKIKLFVRENADYNLRIKFSQKKFRTKHFQCLQQGLGKSCGELIRITASFNNLMTIITQDSFSSKIRNQCIPMKLWNR